MHQITTDARRHLLPLLLCSLSAASAHADTWVGLSGSWYDGSNWSGGNVPTTSAMLVQSDANDRTVRLDDPTGSAMPTDVEIDALGTGRMTLSLETGSLNTSSMIAGRLGAGHLVQNGASLISLSVVVGDDTGSSGLFEHLAGFSQIDTLTLGRQAGSDGRFSYLGGNLGPFINLVIGDGGRGTFDFAPSASQPSPVLQLSPSGALVLGQSVSGDGSFVQQGGMVDVAGDLVVGQGGLGRYELRQGQLQAGAVRLGVAATGTGTLQIGDVSGSMPPPDFTASRVTVGERGQGAVEQSDGQANIVELQVGAGDGGTGIYRLTGGTLTTFNQSDIGTVADSQGEMHVGSAGSPGAVPPATWQSGTAVVVGDNGPAASAGTGLLVVEASGTVIAPSVAINRHGTLSGSGDVLADVINNGHLQVGQSMGWLNIGGDYTQTTDGLLSIELGGVGPEWLNIQGDVSLDGTLDVSLLNPGAMLPGMTFNILFANSVVGQFSRTLFPVIGGNTFAISYGVNSVSLSVVSAVPLPAAAWLFLGGLGGLIAIGRRKSRISH